MSEAKKKASVQKQKYMKDAKRVEVKTPAELKEEQEGLFEQPTKEVAKAETREVSTEDVGVAEWNAAGEQPFISNRDLIIPNLILMQGMSKAVMEEQAKFGDLIDSSSGEAHADFKNTYEVVPFHMQTVWVEKKYDEEEDDYQYVQTVPVDASNDNLPFEYEVDGIPHKRIRTMRFYVLDPENMTDLPKVVSFRSTSLRNGRKLSTLMYRTNALARLSPAGKTILLKPTKDKNDKGIFAVLDFEPGRPTTKEEGHLALDWFRTIAVTKKDEYKTHEDVAAAKGEDLDREVVEDTGVF